MRAAGLGFALAGLVTASCVLPDVEFDPNAGKAAAGRGGTGGGAGSGGKAGGGGAGGGGAGTGGNGGVAGVDLGTQIEMKCSDYCTAYLMACADHEANTYEDKTDCLVTCTTSGWPLGEGDEPGSINCRVIHAGLANTQGVEPHCFHSAAVPTKGGCQE